MARTVRVLDAGRHLTVKRGTQQHEAPVIDLGRRIRHFRQQLGLTQEALARAAKLTPKFVSQIENGRVNPSIGVLERLVQDGLHIPLGVFFLWDPAKRDLSTVLAKLVRQPEEHQRRIVRAIEVLCEETTD